MEKSKVVLLPCDSYEEEKIKELLNAGVNLLGGISSIVKPQEKILLKPNLLKKSETEKPVITHPAVMGAFALLLEEAGCHQVKAGDSCGTGTTRKIMQASGMDEALERHQVTIVDFDEGVRREYPQGRQAREFMMASQVEEADAVINRCKMKTHQLERITGAVKNMYGCIYGFYKAKGHTQYPDAHSFARMLVDLNQYVKPRLYIMDGIVAMEGNGPGSGDPVSMNVMYSLMISAKGFTVTEKCIGCGICVQSCPVEGKALQFRGKKAPEYNYRKCIRCFCCQEMCPQKAIRVKGLRF